MAFDAGQELLIEGRPYRVAPHPTVPGYPYGQEGRAAVVYQLQGPDGPEALKVFKGRYRRPSLAGLAARLEGYAGLPGLQVCRRTVLTPQRHRALLQQHPDLVYAVLMPWVSGPTWMEVLLEKRELTPAQCLVVARALASTLAAMEQQGLAHCDLSGPNLLITSLPKTHASADCSDAVALVDVEQLYGPGMERPEVTPGGSPGYGHRSGTAGFWSADADRFAGAILLAEVLGWSDSRVRQAAWGESYFDQGEIPSGEGLPGQAPVREQVLLTALQERWGSRVAGLFERAWNAESLLDCATFGEWLTVLPDTVSTLPEAPAQPQDLAPTVYARLEQLVDEACRLEDEGAVAEALSLYREALAIAPPDSGLGSELVLIVQELEQRTEVAQEQPSAPRSDPGIPEWMAQAAHCEEQGRYAEALSLYQQIQEQAAGNPALATEVELIVRGLHARLTPPAEPAEPPPAEVHRPTRYVAPSPVGGPASEPAVTLVREIHRLPEPAIVVRRILPESAGALRQVGVLRQRTFHVRGLAFSPYGRALAVGSGNGQVILFNAESGDPIAHMVGHTTPVTCLLVGPDGHLVGAGARDGSVRLWYIDGGRPLHTFMDTAGAIRGLAFSPDGAQLMSVAEGGRIRIWHTNHGNELLAWSSATRLHAMAIAADGKILATGGDEGICLWRVMNGAQLSELRGHIGIVETVAFSPSGAMLASGASDTTVRFWSLPEGKQLRTLRGHPSRICALAFSPDGEVLASGGADGSVRLWRGVDGRPLGTYWGHAHGVSALVFSPDGAVLASGAYDGVRLWGVR